VLLVTTDADRQSQPYRVLTPELGRTEMSSTEMTELRRTIGQLRQCVRALRARYGEAPAVSRLANDVERLDIDAGELAQTPPVPAQPGPVDRSDVVKVPDTPYDPALWEGADDEGVGGHQRHQR
jgi:hypothetical protein